MMITPEEEQVSDENAAAASSSGSEEEEDMGLAVGRASSGGVTGVARSQAFMQALWVGVAIV